MRSEHEKHTCRPQGPAWIFQCKDRAGQDKPHYHQSRDTQSSPLVAGPKVVTGTQMLTALVFSDGLRGLQALHNAIHYFKKPKE